jgi:hypothetical protein
LLSAEKGGEMYTEVEAVLLDFYGIVRELAAAVRMYCPKENTILRAPLPC